MPFLNGLLFGSVGRRGNTGPTQLHPLVETQVIAGYGRRVGGRVLEPLVGQILTGEDGDHSGLLLGRRGVDGCDPGVGERAAEDDRMQHTGQLDVVYPGGLSGYEGRVLLAPYTAADVFFRCFGHSMYLLQEVGVGSWFM